MRTRTLLLAAAALAAGLATSSAQVYSQNVVGYMNVASPSGFSIIANQLNSTNNTVGSLLPSPANGTILYKFSGGSLIANNYTFGSWNDSSMTLNPGEGVIIYNPGSATTITFVGEVKQGTLTTPLPAGFSIVSSQVPQSGLISTDLLFPTPNNGDIVYQGGSFTARNYTFGSWTGGEPSLAVGEAVLAYKTQAQSWVRNFTVGP
jgi:hypothetical protein